jgi:hypothetical protein
MQQIIGLKVPQLADDGGVQKIQLRVENPAASRSLCVCCSTVIFGVCDSVICVKIRYQETTAGECNRLRTLVCPLCATVNCKVCRSAIAL